MEYNQQISTTTKICLIETSNGSCGGWEETTITTFNWADTLAYFLYPFIIFLVIMIFKKRK